MVLCAAYNCDVTYGQGLSMFCFPKNKTLRKKWVDRLKTRDYSPSQHSKLCERHFENDQFAINPEVARAVGYCKLRLKTDAIPSVFDYTPKERDSKRKRETIDDQPTPARKSKAILKRRIFEFKAIDHDEQDVTAPTNSPTTCTASTTTSTEPDVEMDDFNLEELQVYRTEQDRTTYSVLTQTPFDLVPRRHVKLQTDKTMMHMTPEKPTTRSISTQTITNVLPEDLDQSITSIADDDTIRDPDWCMDQDSSYEETVDEEKSDVNSAKDRKFVVFEQCLDDLFSVCSVCGLQPDIMKRTKGSCLIINSACLCGHRYSWSSQPMSGSMPLGNLILAAAILFSGSSPVKILRFLQHAAVQTFCVRTYSNIQTAYLVPAIKNVWTYTQNNIIGRLLATGEKVTVGGDARCCSPGHTAKYGSYSLMDLKSNKILDLQLIQSNEVKNSYAMEMEGLKRCLTFLEMKGVEISDLVTDRHSQVKKFMRTCKPEVKHWFDCWHVAKGIFKKLEAEGKRKVTAVLNDWARSISNHLYWCAASSAGDGDLVKEKWLSILNHVTNVHTGHGEKYPECLHEELDDRQWLKKGTPSFKALQKVVTRKLLITDIANLSPAEQTSGLEAFHKVVCHFAPKLVHYFHSQMEARLYLSALHFNENSSRAQARTKDGQKMFSISYPKGRKGEGIAKEVKEPQTFEYIDCLMEEVLKLRMEHHTYSMAKENLSEKNSPAPLSHSTPHKPKYEVIEGHKRRFNKY